MAQQVSEPRDKVRAREQLAVLFARHRFRRIPDNEREHAIEVVRLAALTMVSPQFHQKAPHDESVP